MNPKLKLGAFLRDHRVGRSLTLAQTAHETDLLSAEELLQIEDGKSLPTMDVLFSLANVLSIDPDEMLEVLFNLAFFSNEGQSSGSSSN